MKWVKLVDSEANAYPHGTIFRLRGKYPYEDTVDFMVFDPQVEDKNQSLIVSSGYKAGLILVHLPKESGRLAIEKDWLVNNWAYKQNTRHP